MPAKFRGNWSQEAKRTISSVTPPGGEWRFTAGQGKYSAYRDGWTEEGMTSSTPEELGVKLDIYNSRSK